MRPFFPLFILIVPCIGFLSPKRGNGQQLAAWNKEQIIFAYYEDKVIWTYKAQQEKDRKKFLQTRAHEVVHGGLLLLTIPFSP